MAEWGFADEGSNPDKDDDSYQLGIQGQNPKGDVSTSQISSIRGPYE